MRQKKWKSLCNNEGNKCNVDVGIKWSNDSAK